ncbi:GrpB family protein [Pseudoalteromonas piscicida]|uniref:GrpB family protein n=1 Tax=Pseudoalteromonas piscicida TaxID=43662 RepID=UPI001C982033|nr:GrpB family protein [Pseudoalteromonas piscicida]QZO14343.1 GrpB family protein [Pseudoalteromonas piscicida]
MSKIEFVPYQLVPASFNPWREIFVEVAEEVMVALAHPELEFLHFGSSSFKVAGKGIIDISVLYKPGQLTQAVEHLKNLGFKDQHSDNPFPDTRPRKDIAVMYQGELFQVHAHAIEKGSEEHIKQEKFKAYMLSNPDARAEYETQKQLVIAQGIASQDEYGKAKAPFVKRTLKDIHFN